MIEDMDFDEAQSTKRTVASPKFGASTHQPMLEPITSASVSPIRKLLDRATSTDESQEPI